MSNGLRLNELYDVPAEGRGEEQPQGAALWPALSPLRQSDTTRGDPTRRGVETGGADGDEADRGYGLDDPLAAPTPRAEGPRHRRPRRPAPSVEPGDNDDDVFGP